MRPDGFGGIPATLSPCQATPKPTTDNHLKTSSPGPESPAVFRVRPLHSPQHVTNATRRTRAPGKERIMFELWAAILAIGILGLEYIEVRAYYHQHAREGQHAS